MLVLATGGDRFAVDAVYNDAFCTFFRGLFAFDDGQYVFLFQAVVFYTMLFDGHDVFFKSTHLLFVAHYFDDIAASHDAQFGIERLDHLYVGVVYPVENNRVHVFQYDMLFYHSLNFAANLSIKF